MASPRLSTRHFGIRKPAQVWTDAAPRHSPPFWTRRVRESARASDSGAPALCVNAGGRIRDFAATADVLAHCRRPAHAIRRSRIQDCRSAIGARIEVAVDHTEL